MLVIPVKDGENIDRALKRFKRKFLKTGTLKQVRSRKQYIKKSERLRVQKQKAVYSENMLRNMDQYFPLLLFYFNLVNRFLKNINATRKVS